MFWSQFIEFRRNEKKNMLITISWFLLQGWARIVFSMEWRSFKTVFNRFKSCWNLSNARKYILSTLTDLCFFWLMEFFRHNFEHPNRYTGLQNPGYGPAGVLNTKRKRVCVSGGNKFLFFENFGALCFLGTPVLSFALLPYSRQFQCEKFQWEQVIKVRKVFKCSKTVKVPFLQVMFCCYHVFISHNWLCLFGPPTLAGRKSVCSFYSSVRSSIRPSIHLSRCFFGIGSLVFSKFWHGVKNRVRTFCKKFSHKWKMGKKWCFLY